MKPFWIWRSQADITHQIGSQSITPIVQSIGLRWPNGGWLWQFPLAVEVEDDRDGRQMRLPIPDPTRTVVWFLCALAIISLFAMLIRRRQSRQRKQQDKRQENEHDRVKG
jgi:hypothetical protein